jgi:hypothetical protein
MVKNITKREGLSFENEDIEVICFKEDLLLDSISSLLVDDNEAVDENEV